MELAKIAVAVALISIVVAAGGIGYLAITLQSTQQELRDANYFASTLGEALGINSLEEAERLADNRRSLEELYEKAKAEGELWFWHGSAVETIEKWELAFNTKYPGIKFVQTRADHYVLADRFITETLAGKTPEVDIYDMGYQSLATIVTELGINETFMYYEPKGADRLLPIVTDFIHYPRAYPRDIGVYANLINTELVNETDYPTTFEALTDPMWKDRIALQFPGGGFNFLSEVVLSEPVFNYDETAWENWLDGLAANNPVVHSSFSLALDAVQKGEAVVAGGIGYPFVVERYKEGGSPVDWVRMEYYIGWGQNIGIYKKAAHPNAAKLFMEWLFSADGQAVMADTDYVPVHMDVGPKPQYAEMDARLGLLTVTDPVWFEENKARLEATVKQKLGIP
jgi:iron(III) transport system substrate-binding protein